MWKYEKRLEFPVNIKEPNAKMAMFIMSQYCLLYTSEKVAALPVKQVFPAHHSLEIEPEILGRMRDVFRELKAAGKLRHGSGKFDYGDWGVWL